MCIFCIAVTKSLTRSLLPIHAPMTKNTTTRSSMNRIIPTPAANLLCGTKERIRFISRNTANSIAVFFAPNQRPRARYRTTTSRYIQIRANRFGALKVADAKTTTSKSFIRGSSSKKRMCLISLLIRSPLFESVFSATVFQEMLQPHIPPQWRQDPQRTLAR